MEFSPVTPKEDIEPQIHADAPRSPAFLLYLIVFDLLRVETSLCGIQEC